jgi:hypothetical protein
MVDSLTKWQLNLTLSAEEAITILTELYEGSDKEFVFNATTKIDGSLYDIYQKFPSTKSDFVLRFSDSVCQTPFVSFSNFGEIEPNHVIAFEGGVIKVYESAPPDLEKI